MNNKNFIQASQYCEKVFDGTHDTPKPTTKGFPLVTSKHIVGGKLDLTTAYNISKEDFENVNRRSRVKQWDVLFSMIGSIGEVYLETKKDVPYAIKNVGVFSSGNEEKAKWLYYYLKSPYAKKHISNYLSGAVQKFLSLGALREFPILPFDSEKSLITSILCLIDQKIELNNKVNAELEAMVKTIYDYWFVQFDFPDESGRPYKSSGGKMIWSEELKREIPKEWEIKRLDEIEQTIITGKTPSTKDKSNFDGEIPFICIGDVRGNMHIINTEIKLSRKGAESQENKFIPAGSICVTCIASPGLIGLATEDSQTNQQLNSIVCQRLEDRYYLYFYLKDYFKFAKAKTGNTFANMNKEDFSSIFVLKPSVDLLELFTKRVNPLISKNLMNSKENYKIAELRDWLLPILMNGQVTVAKS